MKKACWFLFLSVFAFGTFISPLELLAAPYYEGKNITIIVGFGAGGGYDRMARLLSKHLPKYIPGKPVIIVQNMLGASSILAANHVFNIAKPDGLTLGTFGRALPVPQLLNVEGVKYDLLKYSWIGSAAVESNVIFIRSDLPYKTFGDFLRSKTQMIFGRSGPGDNAAQLAFLLSKFAGLDVKFVTYNSSSEYVLALERREVDFVGGSYSGMKVYVERGLMRPFIRGRVSEPEIRNLPVDEDQTTDLKGKTIMALVSAPGLIGRPYVAPPGTSAEVMNILREAFAKATKDSDLLAEAKKMGMSVEFVPVDECLKVLNYVLNQPDDIVKELSKYISF